MEIPGKPTDLEGFFRYYHEFVKVLYCDISAEAELPQEILFEIHAALDHVSRIYVYGEEPEAAIEKAYSHLKRSCLDVFKIRAREAILQWKEISAIQGVEFIDNGDFKRKAVRLISEITEGTKAARYSEGHTGGEEQLISAFEQWIPAYEKCRRFEKEFYLNPGIQWAKSTFKPKTWRDFRLGFLSSYIAGLATPFTLTHIPKLFAYLISLFKR